MTDNPQPDLPARLEAVLTERFTELGNPFSAMHRQEKGPDGWPASYPVGPHHVAEVLRELLAAAPAPGPSRVADEAQQPETGELAAALDGLHTLIATSSRDWQTYRVDAWLWAVLCGWDCEQTEHDETCTHGAMEETAAMHGWDDDTVAKARRYRSAVRAITTPAAVSQPGKEA